jgi:hypothetical protein
MTVIKAPRVLLPSKNIDLTRWSIIACDQFTSEPEYWQQVTDWVGDQPSTLRMVFPEVYLGKNDAEIIRSINQTMKDYHQKSLFDDIGECFVLIDRKTEYRERRLGLIISIDLDAYEYSEQTDALIRATEKTVISRIPPRVKIRQDALFEIPHVQLLMDDRHIHIIENLYKNKNRFQQLYDFELNMKGGHLTGYRVDDTKTVINDLEKLVKNNLLFIVGDGNHSLATAKACWESNKKVLPETQWATHPSRYAMVELINIHDQGLEFEPIHRVLFDADDNFLNGIGKLAKGHSRCITFSKMLGESPLPLPDNAPEAIKLVQDYIDDYLIIHKMCTVDYVHGLDSLKAICLKHPNAIGITLPPIDKKDLFDYVANRGVLPRKSFSMGEASEKRHYLESRKIK